MEEFCCKENAVSKAVTEAGRPAIHMDVGLKHKLDYTDEKPSVA
jgi:hypothetical protein